MGNSPEQFLRLHLVEIQTASRYSYHATRFYFKIWDVHIGY